MMFPKPQPRLKPKDPERRDPDDTPLDDAIYLEPGFDPVETHPLPDDEAFEPVPTDADQMPEPRKRGRPRRAQGKAEKIMVRLDRETATELRLAFGSLGNALYHTAQGLRALAFSRSGLGPDPAADDGAPDPSTLTEAEFGLIAKALQVCADMAPPTAAEAFELALRRLEFALGRPTRGDAGAAPRR